MSQLNRRILKKAKKGEFKVVCLGDSITEGSYLKEFGEEEGFVEVWQEQLREKFQNPKIKIVNKGIDGGTSRDGHNCLYQVIEENPDLVTVMFAHNDRDLGANLGIYERYMRKIVLGLQKYTKAYVLLLTPNALLDSEYDKKTTPYLKVLRRIGQELKVELVDVHHFFEEKFALGVKREDYFYKLSDFLKAGYKYLDKEELYLQRIVHPNQKGHLLIAQALMNFR